MKEVAAYLFVVLVILEVVRAFGARSQGAERWILPGLVRQAWLIGAAVVVFFGLLEVLDLTVKPYDPGRNLYYANAFSHTWHILQYGAQQRSPHGPQGVASYPWMWFINESQINYYTVTTTVRSGSEVVSRHATIAFRGAMNPFIIFAAIPALGACLGAWWRSRAEIDLLPVAWVAGTWLPLLGQSVFDQRTSYLYYMLLVLPGIYIATVRLFSMRGLPRLTLLAWAGALIAGFLAFYPIRTPNW
jgi:hypothetical protein